MNRLLVWRPIALADREAIMVYIANDSPAAAFRFDQEFEAEAELARRRSTLYKPGRIAGTREIVVRPSYVMVYGVSKVSVEMLRVLHTAQQWP